MLGGHKLSESLNIGWTQLLVTTQNIGWVHALVTPLILQACKNLALAK